MVKFLPPIRLLHLPQERPLLLAIHTLRVHSGPPLLPFLQPRHLDVLQDLLIRAIRIVLKILQFRDHLVQLWEAEL